MEKLRQKLGRPTRCLRLLFGGKQLHDSETLQAFGVEAGSTLHLTRALHGGQRLFHCTTKSNAAAIRRNGFKCGSSGIAGGGIYFAASVKDAAKKSHYNGVVLECELDLGRIYDVGFDGDPSLNLERVRAMTCDCVRIPRNGEPGTEYCVYEASRVRVVGEQPDPTYSRPTNSPRICSTPHGSRPRFRASDMAATGGGVHDSGRDAAQTWRCHAPLTAMFRFGH